MEKIHPLRWALKLDIKANAKLVLIALINHLPIKDGKVQQTFCWPSLDELCDLSSSGRTTVIESLKYLAELNLIRIERRCGHGGRKSNIYHVNLILNYEEFNKNQMDMIYSQSTESERSESESSNPESSESVDQSPESGLSQSPKSGLTLNEEVPNIEIPNEVPKSMSLAAPVTRSRDPCRFEEFWMAYPRDEQKKTARNVWLRKKLDRIAGEIIADVEKRKALHAQWQDGIIPHASRYLREERWKDKITERATSPPANKKFDADAWQREQVRRAIELTERGESDNALE